MKDEGIPLAVNYWLDLFTLETWQEFLDAGSSVSGFSQHRWKTVQKFKPGDYLLCYMIGVMRYVGVLKVISKPFQDNTEIWKSGVFPCRVHVEPHVILKPEFAVPILDLRDKLSYFQNMKAPQSYTGHFRSSPAKEKIEDAKVILHALKEAKENPREQVIEPKKLKPRKKVFEGKGGKVTIPENEPSNTIENKMISRMR